MEINLSDPELWVASDETREAAFAELRRQPLSFHPEPPYGEMPAGPGFWALTRYDDVWHASRHPEIFISGRGVNIGDMPVEISEFFGSMIAMDDPRHNKLRGLVNRGFTPRAVATVMDNVRVAAAAIVDRVAPLGECDFVKDIAAALPLQII